MAEDELSDERQIFLTRAEAARYVGASGESAIRAAESNGLQCDEDDNGQTWHLPHLLDAWKWRTKPPSPAQKKRILRDASKARSKEVAERDRRMALELERQMAEWDADRARDEAKQAAETELRKELRQRNRATQTDFESNYMDEATTGRALEFVSYEARFRLRDLVGRGLLRRFDSPCEVRVETSWEGARAVETQWPLCSGGPFYLRQEVLELRRDAAAIAAGLVGGTPKPTTVVDGEDLLSTLMRLVLARASGSGSPRRS